MHEGDLQQAATDLQRLLRLAESLEREPIAISQLVRVAIAQIAFGATWQALQVEGWSDEQLALLQEGWQRHDFLLPFERAITMERAMTDLELNRLRTSLGGAGWLSGGGGAPAAATVRWAVRVRIRRTSFGEPAWPKSAASRPDARTVPCSASRARTAGGACYHRSAGAWTPILSADGRSPRCR